MMKLTLRSKMCLVIAVVLVVAIPTFVPRRSTTRHTENLRHTERNSQSGEDFTLGEREILYPKVQLQ